MRFASPLLTRLLQHPLALALLAVLVIAPGIWSPTGLTGKDEFYLGLRTPMEMMAGDHWLVPFLDEAPRIKKPPMLYWLGRASFETFGPSLTSARLIAVLFAALLVAATAGIAKRLTQDTRIGTLAGLILLGCLGLHSEGRRFMLDVPVAAMSAATFWSFLVWVEKQHWRWLSLAAALLAAGFLIKGPIVALVFGAGLAASIIAKTISGRSLLKHWPALLLNLGLFLALALPWFIYVRFAYPEAAQSALAAEVESRRFFEFSPSIVLGLLNIALPWVFVFFAAAWAARREPGLPRLLLVWFLLTFLPFALLKSFDRYLIGSLLPLAILIAWALPRLSSVWPWRLGLAVALLFGGGLALFAAHFSLGGWGWWLPAAAYLIWAWWNPQVESEHFLHTLAAPAIYGMALLWGVFPALGVNAVPPAVVELGRTRNIAMIDGPQPALLPILSQRAQRNYPWPDQQRIAALADQQALVFIESEQANALQESFKAAGYRLTPAGEYSTLASHGSGLRFARSGAKKDDWKQAWNSASLAPLMTRIVWFEIVRP